MFLLDSLLVGGIRFTLEKIRDVVEQELDSPAALQQQLVEAQLALEEGQIDENQFAAIEADLLARLRELRSAEPTGGIANASSFEDIEVEIGDDEDTRRR
jgi:hypothetical protein